MPSDIFYPILSDFVFLMSMAAHGTDFIGHIAETLL